jgi:cytochrome c oxidase subunit II
VFQPRAATRRPPPVADRSLAAGVTLGLAVTTIILLVWLVASVWVSRAIASPQMSNAVSINVAGHQWWWEVEYPDAPSLRFRTANELHIPVGRPVVLNVTSRDVIHSFWVPNLQGKRDLIPGYTTSIWLQADRPGVYRGQCAEFCGYQHANMALSVTAEEDAPFAAWLAAEGRPARAIWSSADATCSCAPAARRATRSAARTPEGQWDRSSPIWARAPRSRPARCRIPADISAAGLLTRNRRSPASRCRPTECRPMTFKRCWRIWRA